MPGIDELVRADGVAVHIVSLQVGKFEKGVHHIATSNKPATSVDDHLILANGIVAGDYSLQLSLASGCGDIKDKHADAPIFGTKEYGDKHSHLSHTPFVPFQVQTLLFKKRRTFAIMSIRSRKSPIMLFHSYA